MNLLDPNLILIKNFRGNSASYYQVVGLEDNNVVIGDIEHGGHFKFKKEVLKKLIKSGQLVETNADEIPEALFINRSRKIPQKKTDKNKSRKDPNLKEVIDRKWAYLKVAIDSKISGFTKEKLDPIVKQVAEDINDPNPPSWRTLINWNKAYVEGGWKKSALGNRHHAKGNRDKKISQEVYDMVRDLALQYAKSRNVIRYTVEHKNLNLKIEKMNKERAEQGLPLLTTCSYRSFLNIYKNIR